jgi:hypothetical protein
MINGLNQSVAQKKKGKSLKNEHVQVKLGGNKRDGIFILLLSAHTEEILVKE